MDAQVVPAIGGGNVSGSTNPVTERIGWMSDRIRLRGPSQKFKPTDGPSKMDLLLGIAEPYVHGQLRVVSVKLEGIVDELNKRSRKERFVGCVVSYAPLRLKDGSFDPDYCTFVLQRMVGTGRAGDPEYLIVRSYDTNHRRGFEAVLRFKQPGTSGEYARRRWGYHPRITKVSVDSGLSPWNIMNCLGNPPVLEDRLLELYLSAIGLFGKIGLFDPITGTSVNTEEFVQGAIVRCDLHRIDRTMRIRYEFIESHTGIAFHGEYNTRTGEAWLRLGHGWDPKDPYC